MKPAQIQMLRESMLRERERGTVIVCGGWGVVFEKHPNSPARVIGYKAEIGCACALGCLVLDRSRNEGFMGPRGLVGCYPRAMQLLGLGESDADMAKADAIVEGFDAANGLPGRAGQQEPEWFAAGQQLRKEFAPRSFIGIRNDAVDAALAASPRA